MADLEGTQLLTSACYYTPFEDEDEETPKYREALLGEPEAAPVVTKRRGRPGLGRRNWSFPSDSAVPDALLKETAPHYVKEDASEDLLA